METRAVRVDFIVPNTHLYYIKHIYICTYLIDLETGNQYSMHIPKYCWDETGIWIGFASVSTVCLRSYINKRVFPRAPFNRFSGVVESVTLKHYKYPKIESFSTTSSSSKFISSPHDAMRAFWLTLSIQVALCYCQYISEPGAWHLTVCGIYEKYKQ